MAKNNHCDDKEKSVSSLLTDSISFGFDIIKQGMRFFELRKTAKIADNLSEKFDTVENILLKVEKKLQDNQRRMDKLTTLLITSHILLIVTIFAFTLVLLLVR